jgi:hypothetical protein
LIQSQIKIHPLSFLSRRSGGHREGHSIISDEARNFAALLLHKADPAYFAYSYIFFFFPRLTRTSSDPPAHSPPHPPVPENRGCSGIIGSRANNYSSRRARFPVDESAERHTAQTMRPANMILVNDLA